MTRKTAETGTEIQAEVQKPLAAYSDGYTRVEWLPQVQHPLTHRLFVCLVTHRVTRLLRSRRGACAGTRSPSQPGDVRAARSTLIRKRDTGSPDSTDEEPPRSRVHDPIGTHREIHGDDDWEYSDDAADSDGHVNSQDEDEDDDIQMDSLGRTRAAARRTVRTAPTAVA